MTIARLDTGREYFEPVIDLGALLEQVADGATHVAFDNAGALVSGTSPPKGDFALLLVRPVTDAVKEIDGARVRASVDREGLWLVEGFSVDRKVIEAVGPRPITSDELIAAVEDAGFEWKVVDSSLS
jgi:hypothetical protein